MSHAETALRLAGCSFAISSAPHWGELRASSSAGLWMAVGDGANALRLWRSVRVASQLGACPALGGEVSPELCSSARAPPLGGQVSSELRSSARAPPLWGPSFVGASQLGACPAHWRPRFVGVSLVRNSADAKRTSSAQGRPALAPGDALASLSANGGSGSLPG